jgi:hypothetical protein
LRNIERPQLFGVGIHLVEFILQIGLHLPEFSPHQLNQLIDIGSLVVGIRDDTHRRGHASVASEDGVSFSQELFEKDLTEPTDDEDQAYKPADPISGTHYGHRTEDAIAFSHDFFSGNATEPGG